MRKDIVLVVLLVACLALMVIPLNAMIIDILLAVNLTLGVILLMVTVYLKHPSDFSTFPTVILIGTAFRLALSIGTTRMILTEAEAGEIIATFADYVVGGSIAVGMVIFLIITIVQFIVVTKGAERVAEVGARFALDALPGKQMSIDAEVRAGNLTAEEGAARRKRLDRDSRFFGAMDGAMKFVKGDAIAGLIIIFVNLIGGIAVGMTAHGYSFSEAVEVFSLLTIGDGLVSQLPALMMSLCAGIVVTRADGQDGKDLGSDISAELIADPRVTSIGAPIVLGIGLIPGFPTAIFATIAVTMLVVSAAVRRAIRVSAADEVRMAEEAEQEAGRVKKAELELPVSDRVRLRISADLAATISVDAVERHLATHLATLYAIRGVRFPRAVVDHCAMEEMRTVILEIDEVPVFRTTVPQSGILIMGQDVTGLSDSLMTNDAPEWPLVNGLWLPEPARATLGKLGLDERCTEEGIACLAFRVYEQNLGPLFSHAIFNELLAELRGAEPDLMQKIEEELDQGSLHKMFRYLIEDGVPLRPLSLLASSIRYWLTTLDEVTPVMMAECLRGSMKRQLCHRIAGPERVLGLALLGPWLETEIRQSMADAHDAGDKATLGLPLAPELNDRLLTPIRRIMDRQHTNGRQVALVVAADLRRRLRNHLAGYNIQVSVLAPHEIANEIATIPLDLIEEDGTRPRVNMAMDQRSSSNIGITVPV